eukprot:980495-Pelagomonas_calceolata.AAC.1
MRPLEVVIPTHLPSVLVGGIVEGGVWVAASGGVLLASSSLNPYLSRLESSRSAVGRRNLGLLRWGSNSCMRWWKVGNGYKMVTKGGDLQPGRLADRLVA